MKTVALTVLGLALVVASAAHALGSSAAGVEIKEFTFAPAALEIRQGTTVTWTNHDDIPHTVVSTEKVFKSKVLDTSEKFSFTFSAAGTFPYFCSLHPKMTGRVIVQ